MPRCDNEGWVRPKMMGADTVYGSAKAAAAEPKGRLRDWAGAS